MTRPSKFTRPSSKIVRSLGPSKLWSKVRHFGQCSRVPHSPIEPRARAHKEVLFFASPFFEAALSGNWAETGRPQSMSSIITISQPPSNPGDRSNYEAPTEMIFAPMDPDNDVEDF